jgi:hypothetical protein
MGPEKAHGQLWHWAPKGEYLPDAVLIEQNSLRNDSKNITAVHGVGVEVLYSGRV